MNEEDDNMNKRPDMNVNLEYSNDYEQFSKFHQQQIENLENVSRTLD